MAIDREAVAEIVTFAKAAEGFVPSGAASVGKSDFRETNGNLFSYDVEQAKELTKNASTKKLIFGKELRKNFFQRICRLMQFGNFLLIQIDWNLALIAIAANDTRQT